MFLIEEVREDNDSGVGQPGVPAGLITAPFPYPF